MLAIFGPIWILAALGYAARRLGLLDDTATSVLGRFVFHLAMPATLFLTMARTPISDFSGLPIVAFGAAAALVIASGWLLARSWLHRKPGEQVIWAMAAGYVNSANLGIPIALRVLHSTAFLVQVVLLQNLVVTPIILIALERSSDADGRIRLGRIVTLPARNPIILGSALGVLASAAGYRPAGVLATSLSLLAGAAVPTGLIALGAALHSGQPRPDRPAPEAGGQSSLAELAAITALKLVAQPAAAFTFGALALHLTRPQLLAVTICSGLPTAQNTFIFAEEHHVGERLASRAVLVTTTLSLGTLAAIAWLLSR
jgi:malonate transporter